MEKSKIWDVFDEDHNLIKEYENRKLLVRNKNSTLGNCVLIAKRDIANVSDVNENEAKEYFEIIREVESALKQAFHYDKINYLTLMMVDEHVHTHILPRYHEIKQFAWITWTDEWWQWPTTPVKQTPSQEILDQVKQEILKNL